MRQSILCSGCIRSLKLGISARRWTMFEARIKQMISSCAAESWESWEVEAVKYLEEKGTQLELNDDAASLACTQRLSCNVDSTFDIDRGNSDTESEEETTGTDLNDMLGLQHLFNQFFSSISSVEQYREPNVSARISPTPSSCMAVALLLIPKLCYAEPSDAGGKASS